jgi:acyl dehydratase
MSEAVEYHIDNIQAFVGKEIGVTEWMTIDQDRIDRFAEVTEDRNPLHVDPAVAADGPFGQRDCPRHQLWVRARPVHVAGAGRKQDPQSPDAPGGSGQG